MSPMPGRDDVTHSRSGVKLTYDDFVLFPDDGKRHELIGGEHYVTPSPNTKHQTVSVNLTGFIWSYLQAHPIGQLFAAPFDVVLSQFDVVEPDLIYLSNARAADVLTTKHIKGVPELVVEITSPSTRRRDESIKRRLYERMGVSEYWVVDSELDDVRIYRRSRGPRAREGFEKPIELSAEANGVLTTPLLPGLEIGLARLFPEPAGR